MLSPEEFEEEYPPEVLAVELPDSPISSLRDIQHLYGTLYTLATTGGGPYAAYLTPDAARDLVDEPDSLIVVRVDLSGEEPRLADDDRGPVWVTRYTEELIPKVAHCRYPAARGIDHSVTHQSGNDSDPTKLARYATERLSKWAEDDAVRAIADGHADGWVIDALAALGADDTVTEAITKQVERQLGGSTTALLTVNVRFTSDDGYRWPGETDVTTVFIEAMRRRKLSKLVSKNQASDSSGEATDLITGKRTRTVGTAEDPLNYFLGKQLEKFPGLDPDAAWRSHPISEDAAVTLMNAETFVDACTYRTFGAKVYYLPYFLGVPTPDNTYFLYGLLYKAVTADDDSERLTPIERAWEEDDGAYGEGRLRFYISAVMPHQMSRYDVFGETMHGRIQYPATVAHEHAAVLKTAAFKDETDWTAAMPTHENWSLLAGEEFLGTVSSGWYFHQTFPAGDDDMDASADDPRIEALVGVLGGEGVPVSTLLEAYVDRITEDVHDRDSFPALLVASQFAQLCALAGTTPSMLKADTDAETLITRQPTYEDRTMTPRKEITISDGGFVGAEKLESFIESTPALDHEERCATFLLGALVGAVGNYQEYHENRSTTLVDQFPVRSVTRSRIKKITEDAVEKTLTYTRQEKKKGKSYPGTKFDYIVDLLRENVLATDPDDWEIEKEDLRFYYALGITYGMNDRPINSDEKAATTADQN